MATIYLIEKGKEFSGSCYSTMNNGIVNYTEGLTLEQYKEKKQMDFDLYTEEEMSKLFDKYRKGLITEFTEISEKSYTEQLECLPPLKWHSYKGVSIFFMSEAYTADLHTCCISANGKYYSALRSIHEKDDVLIEFLKK